MIVLDASALLALLFRERGHEQVGPLLAEACMTTVNLCEVLARFCRDGVATGPLRQMLGSSPIELVDFDVDLAERAAGLAPLTRAAGLSLGDRACLALAARRGIPALTADSAWSTVGLGLEVQLIR